MGTRYGYRNNVLFFFDSSTHERILPLAPLVWKDEFIGPLGVLAVGGIWTKEDVSAAGVTAEQKCSTAADAGGGVVELSMDGTVEQQTAALYGSDVLELLNLDKHPIVEFVAALKVLPTLVSEIWFGVGGVRAADFRLAEADNGPLIHAAFMFDGSGICTIHTDDAVTDKNAQATGVTVVAEAYHVFRIDFTTITDVLFYIDGVRVAPTVTFDMSNGTAIKLQPYLVAYKQLVGGGVGTLYVDSVKIWQSER